MGMTNDKFARKKAAAKYETSEFVFTSYIFEIYLQVEP